MEQCDRVWAKIDLDAVTFNIESIKQRINKDTKIIAVIKADGYGHGAVPIAKLLEGDTCVWGGNGASGKRLKKADAHSCIHISFRI